MPQRPTALIADDEPLLREALSRQLAQAWPELEVVAQARNGREAIRLFEARRPDVCFLDVHMPGVSGIDAARHIGRNAHLVFVTAFDHYAVQAFAEGVLDYLVKPVELARLAETVARLKERVRAAQPALNTEALLQQLAAQLARMQGGAAAAPLRWIRAQVGQTLRLIPVEDVDYLRSDTKYTRVAWRGDAGQPGEAVVRIPLKELVAQLDPAQFAQVHRSVVVNLRAISHVTRGDNETADIHLRGRKDVLPVSRSYLHLFRQM
ncbi:MAG TPA: LytTR family DNA-binding domain-containing protein [Pseudomonadota bacterium]|nr:LytTR family DNA-binding domain-containing protein [Pseudomonadota bacterium]HQX24261.1 LytTR family DNA-binding domain-containing protein [Pseudomonadota bacterium]HQY35772.1 LytTR family DNA-binding domain-containing protein [Pseudomonadota bacterium]HRA36247.1 LytTR family DNA-binding domain-containing protein [Pseudomonadota bacterium]